MFRKITPQASPAAFLTYQPQDLDLQDLYDEAKPSYSYVAYEAITTPTQEEHYRQLDVIFQKLQGWTNKHLPAEEAQKYSLTLRKFYKRYKKAEIGDLSPHEYETIKKRLETICLLFWKGPKPEGLKKWLFRNFIEGLTVCPDGIFTRMTHLKTMLESESCLEAWLARCRYELVEKAKNEFINTDYDPERLRGGMDIHIFNAFLIEATHLGYAPLISLTEVERDFHAQHILTEYRSIIKNLLNQYFINHYQVAAIFKVVEDKFIEALAATQQQYLDKHQLGIRMPWNQWQGLEKELQVQFDLLSAGNEDFSPATMLVRDEDENYTDMTLMDIPAFREKIRPYLRACVARKLFDSHFLNSKGIILPNGDALYLDSSPETASILTKDHQYISYNEYPLKREDEIIQQKMNEFFELQDKIRKEYALQETRRQLIVPPHLLTPSPRITQQLPNLLGKYIILAPFVGFYILILDFRNSLKLFIHECKIKYNIYFQGKSNQKIKKINSQSQEKIDELCAEINQKRASAKLTKKPATPMQPLANSENAITAEKTKTPSREALRRNSFFLPDDEEKMNREPDLLRDEVRPANRMQ